VSLEKEKKSEPDILRRVDQRQTSKGKRKGRIDLPLLLARRGESAPCLPHEEKGRKKKKSLRGFASARNARKEEKRPIPSYLRERKKKKKEKTAAAMADDAEKKRKGKKKKIQKRMSK